MRVGVEFTAGPNIGDGIYQASLAGLVRAALPDAEVVKVDPPVLKTFPHRPQRFAHTRLASRPFNIMPWHETDLLVLSGPILGDDFPSVYGETIRRLRARGGQYLIASAHCPAPNGSLASFLVQNPPLGIATRDSPSCVNLTSMDVSAYDGVCASFLVSLTCQVGVLTEDLGSYITVAVDRGPEPEMRLPKWGRTEQLDISRVEAKSLSEPKNWRLTRHVDFLRTVPRDMSDHRVIRPLHDIGYKFSNLNFSRPNAFLSYSPESYLSLYRSTKLTVSDRVHSCAPTLAYGNPALFVGNTPRAAIFDRIGVERNERGVMTLSRDRIVHEYEALKLWLSRLVTEVSDSGLTPLDSVSSSQGLAEE